MSGHVSALSMGMMGLGALVCVLIPLALLLYYRKKGADILPFFVGCGVFVVFALLLESLVHNLVLKALPVGEKILGNTLLYALYGGLAAGVFEETGRFLAFRTVLKKRQGNDRNALMYGAGHGGIEAVLLLSATYISYLAMAFMINAGKTEVLTATLAGDALEQMKTLLNGLTENPAWVYLLAVVERVVAITTHICLSVLVWFAAKKPGKGWLYPLAILLHAAYDGAAVLLAARLPLAAVEGCLVVMALGLVLLARRVWIGNAETE